MNILQEQAAFLISQILAGENLPVNFLPLLRFWLYATQNEVLVLLAETNFYMKKLHETCVILWVKILGPSYGWQSLVARKKLLNI